MSEAVIDGKRLLSEIRIVVKMPAAIGLRLWLAARLVGLAKLVSGTDMVVEWPTPNNGPMHRDKPQNREWNPDLDWGLE